MIYICLSFSIFLIQLVQVLLQNVRIGSDDFSSDVMLLIPSFPLLIVWQGWKTFIEGLMGSNTSIFFLRSHGDFFISSLWFGLTLFSTLLFVIFSRRLHPVARNKFQYHKDKNNPKIAIDNNIFPRNKQISDIWIGFVQEQNYVQGNKHRMVHDRAKVEAFAEEYSPSLLQNYRTNNYRTLQTG